MGAYKKLTSKDVIITPFEVNKSFNFSPLASAFTASIGIDSVIGQNLTGSFNSSSDALSGTDNLFRRLVYHNIKQLYYGNYISGSNGFISNAATASFNTDGTIVGPVYTTNYNDFLESTIYATSNTATGSGTYKSFPTADMSRIGVMSIPTKLYGDYIVPGTFQYDIPGSSSLDFDNPEFIQTVDYTDAMENLVPDTNTDIEGVVYNNDGTKIFLLDHGNGLWTSSLFEFTLSTPYDVSSFTSPSSSFILDDTSPTSLDVRGPRGVRFNNDGTKFFIATNAGSGSFNDGVLEFQCLSAFSIAGATFNPLGSKDFTAGIGSQVTDLAFNNDGSKLYICGFNQPTSTQSQINQYNLSPSYDITSSAAASSPDGTLVISVDGYDVSVRGIEFNTSGTLLLVTGLVGDNVNMLIYELTTPFDLNTATQVGSEYLSNISLQQAGISLNNNGSNLIFSQRNSANISQYSIQERILIKDDGQGNLYYVANNELCGNIFYPHGIATITSNPTQTVPDYTWFGFFNKDNWTTQSIDFTSSLTLHETQYKCTIRENEFNYSMNPTLLVSGGLDQIVNGKATYQDFTTGSDFSPYVTTVGLYDEDQNLLAVGKLAKPLPTSQTTDTTILINLDLN